MKFETTAIPGVVLVEPTVHRDARGWLLESWHGPRYAEHGIPDRFVQENHSHSTRGTLRGLHAQSPRWQGKLVRCVVGAVWDVAVDVRLGSPTFGRHFACELSAENFRQLWVPPGLLHGFCVLGECAELEYKCTELYSADADFCVRWDDPELALRWPIQEPVLSPRDAGAPLLQEVREHLIHYRSP